MEIIDLLKEQRDLTKGGVETYLFEGCLGKALRVMFIIGVWADSWEKLQVIPLLIITPLTFLGGSFYSIAMLPPLWQKITLFNPVVYLVSGFRWSFFNIADVSVNLSLGMTALFLVLCMLAVWRIFRTGYRLKT